jgi:hypothetical protein
MVISFVSRGGGGQAVHLYETVKINEYETVED